MGTLKKIGLVAALLVTGFGIIGYIAEKINDRKNTNRWSIAAAFMQELRVNQWFLINLIIILS